MAGRLTVHSVDGPVRRQAIRPGRTYLIGRAADCDIRIEDAELSRRHARLHYAEDTPWLEDLGSKNGVTVNGQRVTRAPLEAPVWISFGHLLAYFEAVSEAELDREQRGAERLRATSLELQRSFNPHDELDALLEKVLGSVLSLTGASRGFVTLAESNGDMRVMRCAGLEPNDLSRREFSGSVGAVELALKRGTPVVTCDALQDTQLGGRPSVLAGSIRALVCLPLQAIDRRIGVIYVDHTEPGAVFTELDLEILNELAGHAALVIAAARLSDELAAVGAELPRDVRRAQTVELLRPLSSRIPAVGETLAGAPLQPAPDSWSRLTDTERMTPPQR